jgi:hypothetical protein
MPRKDDVTGQQLNCVMCPNKIPPDRPRSSVTCSKECATARKNFHRSREDKRACRYCQKPSTPEERLRYQRWRRWEKKHPELVEEWTPKPEDHEPEPEEVTSDAD